MSILNTKEFLESVEEVAYEMLRDMEDELVREMINSRGLAYGDVELNREDRILKFLADDQDGVLNALQFGNPEEYQKRLREFERDAQEAGLI